MSDFSDEQIPWFTTKDYDPSKWDWSRPELRGQLRVGTVLESHDCSYVIVGSVTDEGVKDSVNRGFWPWSSLRSHGFMIYRQPDSTPDRRIPIEEIQPGEDALSDADLWERKKEEGMSAAQATAYVQSRAARRR